MAANKSESPAQRSRFGYRVAAIVGALVGVAFGLLLCFFPKEGTHVTIWLWIGAPTLFGLLGGLFFAGIFIAFALEGEGR